MILGIKNPLFLSNFQYIGTSHAFVCIKKLWKYEYKYKDISISFNSNLEGGKFFMRFRSQHRIGRKFTDAEKNPDSVITAKNFKNGSFWLKNEDFFAFFQKFIPYNLFIFA